MLLVKILAGVIVVPFAVLGFLFTLMVYTGRPR